MLTQRAIIAEKRSTSPEADSNLKKYLKGFEIYWIILTFYLYNKNLSIAKNYYLSYKNSLRGVAQSGSASGLGPEGRRFKSCRPDHFMKINKVVVIGSGTMGSGIAAHLCNANTPVVLLDLKTEIADKAKEKIIKSRPPLLFEKSKIENLKTGNINDDFDLSLIHI